MPARPEPPQARADELDTRASPTVLRTPIWFEGRQNASSACRTRCPLTAAPAAAEQRGDVEEEREPHDEPLETPDLPPEA